MLSHLKIKIKMSGSSHRWYGYLEAEYCPLSLHLKGGEAGGKSTSSLRPFIVKKMPFDVIWKPLKGIWQSVGKCLMQGVQGGLLCHHRNLTTEDWVLPAKFNFAKGWTLCPSQHLTRQAALGFIKINMISQNQHQLNKNFAIDKKPSAARKCSRHWITLILIEGQLAMG